ncbi:hypothetical protein HK100_011772 [Physocladia obscura]|uniref:SCP domain-containing protein n=1 Tax=Physocladia obscura TaxID=109957 RepID=A0AAD5T8P6_9FUNG|nr:hypothetical protein HK100_011772 [Physocladia obscura]
MGKKESYPAGPISKDTSTTPLIVPVEVTLVVVVMVVRFVGTTTDAPVTTSTTTAATSSTTTTTTTTTTSTTTTTTTTDAPVPVVTTADEPPVVVTTEVPSATANSDEGPAPAPQAENDAPASSVAASTAAAEPTSVFIAVATATADAPAPAPQSAVDPAAAVVVASTAAPAPVAVVTTDAVASPSAAVVATGDIADPNIPSASNLPAPAENACNGNKLNACKSIATKDYQTAAAAAASVSSEFNQACLDLNNHARYIYGNPNPYLVWNQDLANWAVVSSAYADTLGCWNCHSYSGSGYSWGQNLYVGESTCADAYFGWVTQEAEGKGLGGEVGHFLNAAGWAIDPSGGTGYTQIGCGTYGNTIVCNFGLGDISTALANMPTDVHTALALALQGTVYTI